MIRLLSCLLGALAAGATVQAIAQSDDEPPGEERDWYQVELIVFQQLAADHALEEDWPPEPVLRYPPELQRLQEEGPLWPATTPFRFVPVEQSAPQPVIDLAWHLGIEELEAMAGIDSGDAPVNAGSGEPPVASGDPTTTDSPSGDELAVAAQEPVKQPISAEELLVQRPFYRLPAEDYEFGYQATRLARGATTRLLFHAAWRQPSRSREDSLPILVESTPVRGDYPALQGSVLLYASRYLHLETNLWLNTDGEYLDSDWEMPRPPLAPPPFEASDSYFSVSLPMDVLPRAIPVDSLSGWLPKPAAGREGPTGAKEYGYRHAVAVVQKRRMRSNELHYIDHPLVGILIKISRFEFEPFVEAGPPESG